MSFQDDARSAARSIFAQVARSVLREASAQCLEQIITQRLQKLSSMAKEGKECLNPEIEVLKDDIELAYEVATQVGTKWAKKLKLAGETDSFISLSLVLKNGRFLDEDFNDYSHAPNLQMHEKQGTSTLSSQAEASSSLQSAKKDNIQSDEESTRRVMEKRISSGVNTTPSDLVATIHSQKTCGSQSNTIDESLSSWPRYKLDQMGWKDPLNFDHWKTPEAFKTENGTSEEWHPLPALENGSLRKGVHIPQYVCLPKSKRQKQDSKQVYGMPAPTLVKSGQKISNDMCRATMIVRDENLEARAAFLKQQIKHVDELGSSNNTLWYPYDYEVILKAADLNKDRLFLKTSSGKKRNLQDTSFAYDIVPKSILPKKRDHQRIGIERNDESETESLDGEAMNERDRTASSVVPVSEYLPNKYQQHMIKRQKKSQVNQNSSLIDPDTETSSDMSIRMRPRKAVSPPPYISRADVLGLPIEDKEYLEKTMIHVDSEEKQCSQILGSLKYLGSNHLWEQVRFGEWNGPIEDPPSCSESDSGESSDSSEDNDSSIRYKNRTRAHRKAMKQRLGDEHELDPKDKQSKLRSKILWVARKSKARNSTLNEDVSVMSNENLSMQFDLGECFMTLPMNQKTDRSGQTKTVAFRSLEVSLR